MLRGAVLLLEWLDRSKLQQKDLAAKVAITDAYLSQVLSGLRRPSLEILIRIEDVSGVPVASWADIVIGEPDEPSADDDATPRLQRVK
jgi:transcriptional regulator with XRE-family HTH domain